MSRVVLDIPDDALLDLRLSPETAGPELLMAAVVKLFELGRISSGAAARIVGIPRVVFLSRLADYGVDTFDMSEEEFLRETRLG